MPAVSIVWVQFSTDGNLSSVAMSDGSRLEGDLATQAYQAITRTHPCKVYCGFDPDAALGKLPVQNWVLSC
jgi:hypothetical protein